MMKDFGYLIEHFFTHKDFLPPASQLPGTMFTPLHFIFAAIVLAVVIVAAVVVAKKNERIKPAFIAVWAAMELDCWCRLLKLQVRSMMVPCCIGGIRI